MAARGVDGEGMKADMEEDKVVPVTLVAVAARRWLRPELSSRWAGRLRGVSISRAGQWMTSSCFQCWGRFQHQERCAAQSSGVEREAML